MAAREKVEKSCGRMQVVGEMSSAQDAVRHTRALLLKPARMRTAACDHASRRQAEEDPPSSPPDPAPRTPHPTLGGPDWPAMGTGLCLSDMV